MPRPMISRQCDSCSRRTLIRRRLRNAMPIWCKRSTASARTSRRCSRLRGRPSPIAWTQPTESRRQIRRPPVTLKTKAKAIAYNAAANSWPGWGDEGSSSSHRTSRMDWIWRSGRLIVKELKLGHRQLGTSQWLVGALHLAAGRSDEAIAAPTRARDAYGAGGERASELLALGYLALARSRQDALERHRAELEEICLQLQ